MISDIEDNRYMISTFGRVYDNASKCFLIEYECSRNNVNKTYISVNLKTINGYRSYFLHRLVFHCFNPSVNISGLDINHENGNKHDNSIWNLSPCTRKENIQHAYDTGLRNIGEDNHLSKISNKTAMDIIKLLSQEKYTSKEICDIVGNNCTVPIVDSIRKKESWSHLSKEYKFHQRPNRLFDENDIHNFCKSFQNNKDLGYSINDNCRLALKENGFEINSRYIETLRKIYTKKYYKNIVSLYNW